MYCYSVWLRHLSLANRYVHGFRPQSVVEVGPGDSIGVGLAAILAGARQYCGLDAFEYASAETNVRVLDELVDLFRRRTPIPDETVFPKLYPRLKDYSYPTGLIDEGLNERLSDASLARLRLALGSKTVDSPISYRCPWLADSVGSQTADMVLTQVALEYMEHSPHNDDLTHNLRAMAAWLKPGGVMSHQIDLSCPAGAPWNHHWAYGSLKWQLIRGRRPSFENRVPLSAYLHLIEGLGLRVMGVEPVLSDGLRREALAEPFRYLPDSDLRARAALIVAVKP
jgi:hypothetical protein